MAGQTVNLTAPTQTNQGLITGQALTLQGADLVNDGSTAAIASTGNLSLQLTNSISNTNGALITAEQDLAIGNATQPVSLLNNNQSTIQAGGNAAVYATTFTNASNPVTVTQSSTSSSKSQTTLGLPSACSQWNQSIWSNDQGDSNYYCGSSFRYIGQLGFSNGTHVDSWQTYSTHTNAKGDSVTSTTYHYEKFTFIQDDPSSKTLTVRLDTLTTSSSNGSSWVFANWSNPDDPIWSNRTVQIQNRVTLTTTQTIAYFSQSGSGYQYIPGYNPAGNLLSADLQSGGSSGVFAMTPGQINTINSLSDVNGAPTAYPVTGNGLSFSAGALIISGRDTVAQVNEISRLTNTTVTTDQASGTANPAQFLVGGNLSLNAQSVTNQYSTIAAGNNLDVQAGSAVNNIGQSLNQTTVADITSTFTTSGNNFGGSRYQTNSRDTTVRQIGSLDAIFAGNQTVTISAPSINNSTIHPANIAASNGSAPAAASNTQALEGNPVSGSFQLPSGGLFHTATAPGQHYLVETDPRFTQYASFISSDYMLSRLGYDPNIIQKRLGDGYYEQQLVSQTITKLTGQRFLTGDTSATQQYQALMNNGVQVAQQFQLSPGIALSAEQIARLTQPIVWLVTQHVDGQDVLVPTVYLPGSTPSMAGQGAVIGGTTMLLSANGSLSNSGTLQTTGGVLAAQAQNIAINGGVVKSDNAITLQASQNLTLASSANQLGRTATVSGGSALLQAGNDLTVSAAKVHALVMPLSPPGRISTSPALRQHSNWLPTTQAAAGRKPKPIPSPALLIPGAICNWPPVMT
jgi:filamentous hemagglutinin